MQRAPIRRFGPVSSLTESTDAGISLTRATNILLRPLGGFRGSPTFYRLFAIGNTASVEATIRALPFTGYASGVGVDGAARTANKTVAVRIASQGKNFLLLYDLTQSKSRGLFYLGDDGTGDGSLDLNSGPVTMTVLAVGLDADARWYGQRTLSQWMLGNGVDDNVCVQLDRTATPGIWRKAASTARPATPSISVVAPSVDTNIQASWEIGDYGGVSGKTITFTADAANFPGEAGNDRIKVTISPSVGILESTISGTGVPTTDPYHYTVLGGQTIAGTTISGGPTAAELVAFVNSDSKVASILAASTNGAADAPDSSVRGPTFLSGGFGDGSSTGFSDRTAVVVARYWDPGKDGLGYEGISSEPSNELVIPAADAQDIQVTITTNPSADGGRFPFIRLYLNFQSGGEEIFSLINPDTPIPNTSTARTGNVYARSGNDTWYSYSAFQGVFPNSSTDTIALGTGDPMPAEGAVVMINSLGTVPGGITEWSPYYVVNPTTTTFQLSLLPGGEPIAITSNGSFVFLLVLTAHGLVANEAVRLTAVTLPTGWSAGVNYYVKTPTTYTFKLSTSVGGSTKNISDAGNTIVWTSQAASNVRKVTIGTNSVIGQAMAEDQHRTPPHRCHAISRTQIWRAGVTGLESRLYASKPAAQDELAPEGANSDNWVSITHSQSTSNDNPVTALYSDDYRLHMHTQAGVVLINPADTDDRREPQLNSGAINPACLVPMPDRRLYYLSASLELVAFDANLNYNEVIGKAASMAAGAQAYIRGKVDAEAIAADPSRAVVYHDQTGQLLWLYLPGTNGALVGFAYDQVLKGIVGEFTVPRVYAVAPMERARSEIVFCDEDGNLFWTDPAWQPDHFDNFGDVAEFSPTDTSTAPPTADNGYSHVDYHEQRYLRAYEAHLETAFWDMGDPEMRKAFLAFVWRTVAGSRAIVEVTLETLDGQETTFIYGDVGDYGTAHRALLMASDTAIRAKLRIISAEQKPWVIRDVGLSYTPQQAGSA